MNSKRQATDDNSIPAAKRLKHNVDAMGCLISVIHRENHAQAKEITELKEQNGYLHRQVERLDKYTEELEGRIASMEAVVSNLLNSPTHWQVESVITEVRATRNYDMTDLDRLLDEYETEDDLNWLDELENLTEM